jgi:nicotinic acid mononucleotide adenylyltransferase
LEFIEAPLLEISSNQIRQLIANGQPYRYYLPFGVFHLIEELALYQQGEHDE